MRPRVSNGQELTEMSVLMAEAEKSLAVNQFQIGEDDWLWEKTAPQDKLRGPKLVRKRLWDPWDESESL